MPGLSRSEVALGRLQLDLRKASLEGLDGALLRLEEGKKGE